MTRILYPYFLRVTYCCFFHLLRATTRYSWNAFFIQGHSGFGLAGDTNISWNLLGGIEWWVNRSIFLQLGYRFYEIDYQNGTGKGEFGMNLDLNGRFLGATFYF